MIDFLICSGTRVNIIFEKQLARGTVINRILDKRIEPIYVIALQNEALTPDGLYIAYDYELQIA